MKFFWNDDHQLVSHGTYSPYEFQLWHLLSSCIIPRYYKSVRSVYMVYHGIHLYSPYTMVYHAKDKRQQKTHEEVVESRMILRTISDLLNGGSMTPFRIQASKMQIFDSIIGHEGIKRIQTEQKYQYVPQGYRSRTHSFYRKMHSFHHKIHIGTMYCLYPRQLMLMLILLSFVDLAYHQKNIVLPVFVVGQMECLELYL